MFTPDEILMLAKAGFSAQQIAGLSMVKEQPAPAPVAPAPAPVAPALVADPVLAELQKLTGLVQNSNILQSAQPKVQTPEEILAEIINPAPKGDK